MSIIDHKEILLLRETAINAGLGGRRDALFAGMPESFRASLSSSGVPADLILKDLDALNAAPPLDDGTPPLARWLENAIVLTQPRAQEAIFRQLHERVMARHKPDAVASDLRQTKLWQTLQQMPSDHARDACRILEACVRRAFDAYAEEQSDTMARAAFLDDNRAIRVAAWMGDVIPPATLPALSSDEIALLLLAAMLHDVGMTAERQRLARHYNYLLGGDPKLLSADELNALQRWLDEATDESDDSPNALHEAGNADNYYAAALSLQYYQSKRSEWTRSWIEENLPALGIGTPSMWLSDLILLCTSLEEDFAALRGSDYDPKARVRGTVHLRYLACVLRIANAMELALPHIEGGSKLHVSISVERDPSGNSRGQVRLLGEPRRAKQHRVLEEIAADIERELALCNALAEQIPFENSPGLSRNLPHRWDLASSVYRDIRPGPYEYIDGGFRPNVKRLLEILGGIELYGDAFAAMRELVQNAFDAVREQIALERLKRGDPVDTDLVKALQASHLVEIRVEARDGRVYVVCTDSGAGMTKLLIRDHLLAPRSMQRREIIALERRCKERGFSIERTGQFGIGVLSYFMLADQVTFRTLRSSHWGEMPEGGWEFEIEGIDSFGELRKYKKFGQGTEVELRIRPECLKHGIHAFSQELVNYLANLLHYLPCKLQVILPDALPSENAGPGWAQRSDELQSFALRDILTRDGVIAFRRNRTPEAMLPFEVLDDRRVRDRAWRMLGEEIQAAMRFDVREFDLPDGLGRARLHLPWFDLPGGRSVAYMRVRPDDGRLVVTTLGKGHAYIVRPALEESVRGIRTGERHHVDDASRPPIIQEIDWTAKRAATVSVDRKIVQVNGERSDVANARKFVAAKAREMRQKFLVDNSSSLYDALNRSILHFHQIRTRDLQWLALDENAFEWKTMHYPLIRKSDIQDRNEPDDVESNDKPDARTLTQITWNGKSLTCIEDLIIARPEPRSPEKMPWANDHDPPDLLTLRRADDQTRIVPVWTGAKKVPKRSCIGRTARFPDEWAKLICGVTLSHHSWRTKSQVYWNSRHPLLSAIEENGWRWAAEVFGFYSYMGGEIDPLEHMLELNADRSRAASWIAICLAHNRSFAWQSVIDRDPSFLAAVWQRVFGAEDQVAMFWDEGRGLHTIGPRSWSTIQRPQIGADPRVPLPDPGPAWWIDVKS